MTDTTQTPAADTTQPGGATQTTDTTAAPSAAAPATPPVDAATTPPAGTPPAEVVYDLKLPEGMPLDEATATEFKALAKEMGLTPEHAQKLVDLQVKTQQAAAEAHVNTVKEWRESVVNDPVIGGEKLAENMAIAKTAVELGPPELKDLLKQTGMDNHPVVFKWCLAVGKAMKQDGMVRGSGAPGDAPKSAASVLYPTMAP